MNHVGLTINFRNFVASLEGYEKETIHVGHPVYAGIKKPANARVCRLPKSSHRMGSQFLPQADCFAVLDELMRFWASSNSGLVHFPLPIS